MSDVSLPDEWFKLVWHEWECHPEGVKSFVPPPGVALEDQVFAWLKDNAAPENYSQIACGWYWDDCQGGTIVKWAYADQSKEASMSQLGHWNKWGANDFPGGPKLPIGTKIDVMLTDGHVHTDTDVSEWDWTSDPPIKIAAWRLAGPYIVKAKPIVPALTPAQTAVKVGLLMGIAAQVAHHAPANEPKIMSLFFVHNSQDQEYDLFVVAPDAPRAAKIFHGLADHVEPQATTVRLICDDVSVMGWAPIVGAIDWEDIPKMEWQ